MLVSSVARMNTTSSMERYLYSKTSEKASPLHEGLLVFQAFA